MPLSNPQLAVIFLLTVPIPLFAQSAQAPSIAMPRLISVSGARLADGQPPAAVETVTLAVYGEETGGTSLWQETQRVAVDAEGRYTLLLGATQPDGVPLDVFASGQAQWLGITFHRPGDVEGARMRITSVPYALHAADAVTLGGRPASDFLLTPTRNGLATTGAASATTGADTTVNPLNVVLTGTPNALAKYVNADDVGPSAVSEASGRVGINTGAALPVDYLHVKFNDSFGAFAGLAMQNLSNSPNASSGMLFYDHNGVVSQFQGFNNTNHAYVINNVAKNGANQFDGSISFLLGGTPKFLVAPNGNVGIGTVSPAHHLTVIGGPTWTANGWTGAVAFGNGSALGWYANGAGNRFGIGQTGGGLYFFRTASDPGTTGGAAPTYDVIINDAGNVGIGTTIPTSKLEIAAQDGLKISGFQPFLTLNDTNSGSRSIVAGGNGELGFYPGTFIGGVPAVLIKNGTGNVGIGVSDPTAKLQVAGPFIGVSGQGSYQGVYGSGHFGVVGTSSDTAGYGVYGESTDPLGWGGYFSGWVRVVGSIVTDGDVYAKQFLVTSDRSKKANFANVNSRSILQRLASIPIQTWNFKSDIESVRHLGPMAQDFRAAFNLGTDDKHIATVDADGVALAAIQGLYQLVQENEKQLEQQGLQLRIDDNKLSFLSQAVNELKAENDALKDRVAEVNALKIRVTELERMINELLVTNVKQP